MEYLNTDTFRHLYEVETNSTNVILTPRNGRTETTYNFDFDISGKIAFVYTPGVTAPNSTDLINGRYDINFNADTSSTFSAGALYQIRKLDAFNVIAPAGIASAGYLADNQGSGTVDLIIGIDSLIRTISGGGAITRAVGARLRTVALSGGIIDSFVGIEFSDVGVGYPNNFYAFDFQGDEIVSNSRSVNVLDDGVDKFMPLSLTDTGITFDSTDLVLATTTTGDINLNAAGNINMTSNLILSSNDISGINSLSASVINGGLDSSVTAVTQAPGTNNTTVSTTEYVDTATTTAVTQLYFEQIIWAEENGGLTNNSAQYSFGNGATGNIGIPVPWDCEALGMVYQGESGTGSADLTLVVNGVDSAGFISVSGSGSANGQINTFPAPVPLNSGDSLGFVTRNLSGALSDVRVGVRVRVPIIVSP